jgi:Flp pilus assembly protein CpaB
VRRRRTIAIIVSIALALAAAGLVWWYVSSVKTDQTTEEEAVTVVVARETIPESTTGDAAVQNRLVEEQSLPKQYAVDGVLTNSSDLQGKVFQTTVAKGQQIVASQLGAPETQSMSFKVEKGMRAVSVPVDRQRGVGGLIRDGDRVDVIATFPAEVLSQGGVNLGAVLPLTERERLQKATGVDLATTASSVSRIVLQQVNVLKIDPFPEAGTPDTGGESTTPADPVIVLQVTPDEAERLVFAQEQGKVWFALIPAEDTKKVITPGRAILNEYQ